MKTALVTGGCGFIGSHIVDFLIENNYKVRVIDNLSSNVHEQFYFNKDAEYYHYDVSSFKDTEHLYNNVNYVFHCAAQSRIQLAIDSPIETIKNNITATNVVLECAKKYDIEKVIFSSTSSSYGLKNKPPYDENMPLDCLNHYSVSKVACENLCKIYSELYGLSIIILRYFNVYGEREPVKGHYAPVVGLFLRQFFKNEPLTIVGNGKQKRDFTNVKDVVVANMLAARTNLKFEVFNVGTGNCISINKLASLITNNVEYIPPRLGEAKITKANICKIKKMLGWVPKTNVKEYIKFKLNEKTISNS